MTLTWRGLKRKKSRSRSNSPPLGHPKFMRTQHPDVHSRCRLNDKRKKSFRFIYRTCNADVETGFTNGFNCHMLKIPATDLEWLKDVDVKCYTRHDHCRCNPTQFRPIKNPFHRVYLGTSPLTPFSSPVFVGSKIYSLFSNSLEFWSFTLKPITISRLPSPLSPKRYFSTAFSLRGKVYLWGGFYSKSNIRPQHFGEVYDPNTKKWSPVRQPPNVTSLISKEQILISSLGESEGKVMVYDYDTPKPRFYLYNVVADNWVTIAPPAFLSCNFEPQFMYGQEVINEDNNHLYWIDQRMGHIYAFDWKSFQLYSGPIVGMEHVTIFRHLNENPSGISLHHLWDDFFCLLWSFRVYIFPHSPPCAENHFTFLRVVKDSPIGSLTAFVLGCFVDSIPERPRIYDAISI